MQRSFACLLVAALALVAATASGQPQHERARELDRQAREAFKAGEWDRAAALFDDADRLAPFPELRYNAALAWERARQAARAADAYEHALGRGGLDPEREHRARSSLAALKERLAYVRVPGPVGGTLSVAHLSRAPIPVNFHLDPGEHTLIVERASGARTTERVSLRAGQVFTLEIPSEHDRPAPPPRPAVPPSTPAEAPGDDDTNARTTWGVVALGAAAVFGGGSVYFGIQTQRTRDDYEAGGYTSSDLYDRGVRYRTLTNVALGAAVLSAGIGTYLLVSGGSDRQGRRRGPTFALGAAGTTARAALIFD